MSNLSQEKRERMLAFLQQLKNEHKDDDGVLIALGEIESELTNKKFGLVWEKHEEAVDVKMRTHIPVFTERSEKEISAAPGEAYNFLLEGDNLHSLRLLERTHKGKIDVIYIDPPYNTGSHDFCYDDAFVEKTDLFSHSKWLSFMAERLTVAGNLLTEKGIMVISIGYQEVHNLMVLCQELFDSKQITCVTVQTSGGKPNGGFNITHEYAVFITPTDFEPNPTENSMNEYSSPYHGMNLATFNQVQRPNQAYPIFISKEGVLVGCGKSLADRVKEGLYTGELKDFEFDYDDAPQGTVAVWPVTNKGDPCVWRLIPSRLLSDWAKGYIKIVPLKSKNSKNLFTVQYLSAGVIKKINTGEFEFYRISDRDDIPTIDVRTYKTAGAGIQTIWTDKQFYTTKGSNQIKDIFKAKAFPYPKPLELIESILQKTTSENSIILDFFAGSATTAHAVLELNAADGGQRKFILCTSNESDICENVTYPRIKTVVTGVREDGSRYSDGLKCNLKFYQTDFIAKDEEYLSDALLEHMVEMIQLEHGVKIDGRHHIIIMSDEEADELAEHWAEYTDALALYVSRNVLFTTEQNALFRNVEIHIIPDYYFSFELKEAGEAW